MDPDVLARIIELRNILNVHPNDAAFPGLVSLAQSQVKFDREMEELSELLEQDHETIDDNASENLESVAQDNNEDTDDSEPEEDTEEQIGSRPKSR